MLKHADLHPFLVFLLSLLVDLLRNNTVSLQFFNTRYSVFCFDVR